LTGLSPVSLGFSKSGGPGLVLERFREVFMTAFPSIHQSIEVSFRYGVHFTTGVFSPHNPLLAEVLAAGGGENPKKILAVVDNGLHQHHPRLLADLSDYCHRYGDNLVLAGPPVLVPGGEAAKNSPAQVHAVHQAIHQAGLCRHSYVVALGGGAVVDMVGYAAATAHRGLRLLRLPTTVMAQADASIGVKNSLNAFGKKNFLGTFAPPWAVINDFNFLATLSSRDWLSGLAEAVKVALLKDSAFFDFLEQSAPALVQRDLPRLKQVIHRCAALHLDHIATGGDPFESGSSRPLDFGHWAAHKLEHLSGYQLRHGEAVAVGIALDATYSHLAGLLDFSDWQRILTVLERLSLPVSAPQLADVPALLQGLKEFREHLGGRLTVILLAGIGLPLEVHELDVDILGAALTLLRHRAEGSARRPAAAGLIGELQRGEPARQTHAA
jgi:3-dehydroquinate synthase